jgi:Nif-specific regulatory protein
MVGTSGAMLEVYRLIEQVANSNATVLIRGESGTGKDLIAHAIHYNSFRSAKPFIKVNCTALPENLLESELFGHEKGAFTGAVERKPGRFELADGGTLFLDEIGDFSLHLQVKLLRVIQFKEFERVGGYETLKSNVRIVVATNKNLEEEIKNGLFREDLYYRINVFPIYMPPLRDRKNDVMLLADYFLEKYAKENHKDITRISTPAIEMLTSYHWPGNVRELENCITAAAALASGGRIGFDELPTGVRERRAAGERTRLGTEMLEDVERRHIELVLRAVGGNKAEAARMLGINRATLYRKLARHGLERRSEET